MEPPVSAEEKSADLRPALERFGASAAQLSSLRPAQPLLRRGLWVSLGALVFGSVAAAASAAWSNLPDFDWRLRPLWLAGAVLAFTTLHLTHAALWRRLLASLGHRIDVRRSRSIWCTSGLARYTPGSILMPMVRAAMTEPEGVSKRICLASVVYELALLLTGAVVVGAYALVSASSLENQASRYLVLAVPFVALAGLHPAVFRPLADLVLRRLGRDRLPFAMRLPTVVFYAAVYALTWILAGVGIYLLLEGVHPVAPDNVGIVIAAPAVGYVAAALAFMLPAGLGARETALAVVLSAAVPLAVAVAVAVVVRLVQLGVELACAAITPLLARSSPS